jgi:protein phosphatase
VGASASAALAASVEALEAASSRGVEVDDLLLRQQDRRATAGLFVEAYGRYCWNVQGIEDLRLAPFQVLAGESATYVDRDHGWHMGVVERLAAADGGLIQATRCLRVDVTDPESQQTGVAWWEDLTSVGGEGMVVKPWAGITRGRRGLAQPGIKVRGREYLRIIYGPEYTAPTNLERLMERGLGHKRSLAVREFALGVEALERFVRKEPLYRVHECVFGVLALESEPVDPRL